MHSGHVRFLEEADAYGDVYVGIGSDQTVFALKGQPPVNTQEERKYMIEALKHVKRCFINTGSGILDFVPRLQQVAPDILVVNEDGHITAKRQAGRSRAQAGEVTSCW